MLEYHYLNYQDSPNSQPILYMHTLASLPKNSSTSIHNAYKRKLEREYIMERNAAHGYGFPAGGAADQSYGPGVRYGDPQRPYKARNVYDARGTYEARDAYHARDTSGYYPHSTPYTQAAPAYTDPPKNFGYQQQGYEAPYYEPYPHMGRSHFPPSQNSPLALDEIEEYESDL
jgi:hypothetical protein